MSNASIKVVIDFTGESRHLSESIKNPPHYWLDVSKPNLLYRNRFVESLVETSCESTQSGINAGGVVSVFATRPHMLRVSQ